MDDDDHLRFLFAKAFEHSVPTDDCPAPGVLLDAILGVSGPAERREAVDHVAGCPSCAEAWRLARRGTEAP